MEAPKIMEKALDVGGDDVVVQELKYPELEDTILRIYPHIWRRSHRCIYNSVTDYFKLAYDR